MAHHAESDRRSAGDWRAILPDLAETLDQGRVAFDDVVEAHSGRNRLPAYEEAYPLILTAFKQRYGTVDRIVYGLKKSGVALTSAPSNPGQQSSNETATAASPQPGSWAKALRSFGIGNFRSYQVHIRFNPGTKATVLGLQNLCEYYRVQRYRVDHTQYAETFAERLFDAAQAVMQLDDAQPDQLPDKLASAGVVVDDVRHRYDWIQNRIGSLSYLWGLLLGVIIITVLLSIWVLLALLLHGNLTVGLCMAGGAIAATANSMFRLVQGAPTVKGEDSRTLITIFAAFRPALGAIFALIAYALVIGGFLPVKAPIDPREQFWFVIGVSFIAGFTEGFTPDLLERASHQFTSGPAATRLGDTDSSTER